MQPLISIIIPFYNSAAFVANTIKSIENQEYSNWECVLVDDESTDNSFQIINDLTQHDSRFQLHKKPLGLKKGPNSCRNFGFMQCKGEIINWFDSDDLYEPMALQEVVNAYEDEIDAVVVKVERFDSVTGKTVDYNNFYSENIIDDYLKGHITFYVCGPFWKRSFLEKQPCLFDNNIRNLDDWDFNLRMLYQNLRLSYIDKPLIKYRKFHLSLSKALVLHDKNEILSAFYAREKHVKLLKLKNRPELKSFNLFIINQYKKHLKALLYANDTFSKTILKYLILKQVSIFHIFGAVKSLVIGLLYLLLGRGAFLLRKL